MTCMEAWNIVAPLIAEHMNRIPHESGQLNALDEAYVRVFGACLKQDERERSEDA